MKIKTITCHDVYNAGASLQAYALMTYLKKLGNDVEIIDYKPDYLSNHYNLWTIANPKFEKNILLRLIYLGLKLPRRIIDKNSKKKKLFDDFTKNYLTITTNTYHSNDELCKNPPEADLYIAGSDQIWNSLFKNGKDPAFYLDFVPSGKIRASYAASFATNKIADGYQEQVKKWLEKINYIGIRETSGVELVKNIGIEKAVQVLDPVFLLERKEWDELAKNSSIQLNNEKYLVVYDFDNNEKIKDLCLELAKKQNLKIYSFFKNDYADKVINNYGPIEFLSIIKNSSFVISNSFHGTAFALIYEKQFYVVNRKEGINTRMRDLLILLNIDAEVKKNYQQIKDSLNDSIIKSKSYIDKILFVINGGN